MQGLPEIAVLAKASITLDHAFTAWLRAARLAKFALSDSGQRLGRLSLFSIVLGLLASAAAGGSAIASDDQVPWNTLAADASDFVSKKSPESAFPFRLRSAERYGSPGSVYAHYFPIWRLSLDNKPRDKDFWALNEHSFDNTFSPDAQKYSGNGGFFRDRPMTPPPYNSPFWRQRNFAIDILRAQRIGIDGFIIGLANVEGSPLAQIPLMLCEVASHVAPGFRVAMQPDLASPWLYGLPR